MQKIKRLLRYFTLTEKALWCCSAAGMTVSFLLFDRSGGLTLAASLIGVTSLIFSAKGNPAGQVMMIVFSLLYGVISASCAYYGEMLTYLGMTMPMAAAALIAWLRHPYGGKRSSVCVGRDSGRSAVLLCLLTAAVTAGFCPVLAYFHTAHLCLSTLSVATSFAAVYLTALRSPFFAAAYAANDLVLILLWSAATASDRRYLPVTVCFAAFLVNDLYGFVSWRRMARIQAAGTQKSPRSPERTAEGS